MDCERQRSWMSLPNKIPRRWIVFFLLAVLCMGTSSVTVDMPQIADMPSIGASGFSCEGKVIGGYYADIASGCQMFHVCTLGQEGEIRDIKFLCLAGTVFDQETRVCERVDEVDCANSEAFYSLNLDLYGQHGLILQTGRKVPSGEAGTFADEQNLQQTDTFYDYSDYDDAIDVPASSSTTTTTTTSTTTTTTTTTQEPTTTTRPLPTDPIITEPTSFDQPQNEISTSTPQSILHQEFEGHHAPPPAEFQQPTEVSTTTTTTTTETFRRTEVRPASEIAEDEDVLRLLGQIEADVPRIPSFGKSANGGRNNVFIPRVRRQVASTDEETPTTPTPTPTSPPPSSPRRNRTRRPGQRRGGYATTLPTAQVQITELASPVPADDKGPFTCVGRIIGGFYADVSSGCRRFFICGVGKKNRVVSHTFSCGVGLLFDQATLTCQDIDKVDCSLSPTFYYLNDPALRPDPEASDTFQGLKTKSSEAS